MANINDPNRSMTDRGLKGETMGSGSRFDPITENNYWSENWSSRPYARADLGYSHYEPAYRFGWESRQRYAGRKWDDVESNLSRDWDTHRGSSRSTWEEIKDAVKDAWHRIKD